MLNIPPEFENTPEAARLRRADAALTAAIKAERRVTQPSGERVHLISERLRHAQDEVGAAQQAFDAATGEPKRVGLTPAVVAEISRLFPTHQHPIVADLLDRSCGRTLPLLREATAQRLEFVRLAALKFSNGDVSKLRDAIELAHVDWRDLVMASQSQ
jgi:hypothetical protein